jgi:hypothetical protein
MPIPSDIDLVIEDRQLLAGCVSLLIEVEIPRKEHVRDFVDRGLAALGDKTRWFTADNMKRPAAFGDKALDKLDTWLSRPRDYKQYWMRIDEVKEGMTAASLKLDYRPRPVPTDAERRRRHKNNREIFESVGRMVSPPLTSLRLTLPMENCLSDPAALLDWLLGFQLIADGAFATGHAGLGVNVDIAVGNRAQHDAMTARLAALLARHPGLVYDDSGSRGNHMMQFDPDQPDLIPRFVRVNWLTMLRLETLALCGPIETVVDELSAIPTARVHRLPGSIALQIGDAPVAGDVTAHEFLEQYRAAARILSPARLSRYQGLTGDAGAFPDEAAQAWLDAFEGDLPDAAGAGH